MKRTLIAIVILIFAGSVAMAQTQAKTTVQTQTTTAAKSQAGKTATQAQAGTTSKDKPAHKVFKGVIQTVTLADAAKGTKPEVSVLGAQKKAETFLVVSTTTLTDLAGKALTLDKLQAGEKIRVAYLTTPENIREAVSIHLLK
jgi:Tfp pilus assembly protein PilV